MTTDSGTGERYSLVYLPREEAVKDSRRMRQRLIAVLDDLISRKSGENFALGKLIERELGLSVLESNGHSRYFYEDRFFIKCDLRDFLDAVTLIFRLFHGDADPTKSRSHKFIHEVRRIFSEEPISFRIDDQGGVHPLIDQAFEANRVSAVRGLEGPEFNAARAHIEDVDNSWMAATTDHARAVRSVFLAAENIFKQMFPKAGNLSFTFVDRDLKPLLKDARVIPTSDFESSEKNMQALIGWINASHHFRHEPGKQDPAPPSEDYAVLLVSNGLAYARWLGSLQKRMKIAGLI